MARAHDTVILSKSIRFFERYYARLDIVAVNETVKGGSATLLTSISEKNLYPCRCYSDSLDLGLPTKPRKQEIDT